MYLTDLVMAVSLVTAVPALAPTVETMTSHPAVEQVICAFGKGTAVRISPGRFISVEHVTNNFGCRINGEPIRVEYSNAAQDFSIVLAKDVDPNPVSIDYTCDGFKDLGFYYAIGYAEGLPVQRNIVLRYSRSITTSYNGYFGTSFDVLIGPVAIIPGMSGGPVLDSLGRITGVNNAYHPVFKTSHSRSIKDTVLCK